MSSRLGLLALGLALLSCSSAVLALPDTPLPWYEIDLSQPPHLRWRHVCHDVLAAPGGAAAFATSFAATRIAFGLAGCHGSCQHRLARVLERRWPEQYAEIAGIVACARASGHPALARITQHRLAAIAYMYEVVHAAPMLELPSSSSSMMSPMTSVAAMMGCTSDVACGLDGRVIHGRNLDWGPAVAVRTIAAAVRWVNRSSSSSSSPVLFETVDTLSEGGTVTGARAGDDDGLTVSLNLRYGRLPLDSILACIEANGTAAPIRWELRRVLSEGRSFAEAVEHLTATPTCAPMYLVLAGARRGEGVVITKPGPGMAQPLPTQLQRWVNCDAREGNDSSSGSSEEWFVAQTNYDAWTVQPSKDDRLGLARAALAGMGRTAGATAEGQYRMLSVPGQGGSSGVLNEDTVLTAVMAPRNGTVVARIRHEPRHHHHHGDSRP